MANEVQGPVIVYQVDLDDSKKQVVDFAASVTANLNKLAQQAEKSNARWAKSVRDLEKEYRGSKATEELHRIEQAITAAGGASKLSAPAFEMAANRIQKYVSLGGQASASLLQMTRAMDEAKAHAIALDKAMDEASAMHAQPGAVGLGGLIKGEAAEQAKQLANQLGPVGNVLSQIGPEAIAAGAGIAVTVVAMKELADASQKAMDWAAKVSDTATTLSTTTDQVQRLEFATNKSGTSFELATGTVAKLKTELVDAPEKFERLGLKVDELRKMDPVDVFVQWARAVEGIEDSNLRASVSQDMVNKSWKELEPLVQGGLAAMRDAKPISADLVKTMNESKTAANVLSGEWEKLWISIGSSLVGGKDAPEVLTNLATAVSNVSEAIRNNLPLVQAWFGPLITAAKLAGSLAGGVAEPKPVHYMDRPGAPRKPTVVGESPEEKKAAEAARKAAEKVAADRLETERRLDQEYARAVHQSAMREQEEERARIEKAAENAIKGEQRAAEAKQKAQEKIIQEGAAKGKAMLDALAKKTIEEARQRAEAQATFEAGNILGSVRTALTGLPNVIQSALQGGGDVMKSIGASLGGSLGKGLFTQLEGVLGPDGIGKVTAKLGKTLSGILGSAMPVVGTLLGSGIGKVFDSIFGGGEKSKVKQMRADFIASAGGLETLTKRAREANIPLDRLFNARKVKDFESAVNDVQRALDTQAQAQEELKAAQQELGLTDAEMGATFNQRASDEKGGAFLKRFEILKAAGADMAAVMAKMGPGVNEWVQAAVAAGTQIPEAMRPMLQSMLEAGQLTDANGVKLEDLGSVNWTDTITDGLRDLITTLGDLVTALGGVSSVRVPPVKVPVEAMPVNAGGANGPGYTAGAPAGMPPFIPAARGLDGWVNRPTHILAGEAGLERVQITPAASFGDLASRGYVPTATEFGAGGGVGASVGSKQGGGTFNMGGVTIPVTVNNPVDGRAVVAEIVTALERNLEPRLETAVRRIGGRT